MCIEVVFLEGRELGPGWRQCSCENRQWIFAGLNKEDLGWVRYAWRQGEGRQVCTPSNGVSGAAISCWRTQQEEEALKGVLKITV